VDVDVGICGEGGDGGNVDLLIGVLRGCS